MSDLERLREAITQMEVRGATVASQAADAGIGTDLVHVLNAARAYRDLLVNGKRVWRCVEHNADFLEKSPEEYSMCMAMLYENAWDALPEPEPCRPAKVVVVHPTTEVEPGEET